ncbi:MAG: hypothetical protein WEB93_05480 [Sphingomonadales bacterium]
MTKTIRNTLIMLLFFLLSACTNTDTSPWKDTRQLYNNEIAPMQARVSTVEDSAARSEREIAALRKEIEELRAEVRGDAPLRDPDLSFSSIPRDSMSREAILARDRALRRDYGVGNNSVNLSNDAAQSSEPTFSDTGADDLHGLHLASYASMAAAARGWKALTVDHGDLLSALTPWISTVTMPDSGRVMYRLLAGPLTSADDARRTCQRLSDASAYCKVIPFDGDPLMVD